MGYPLLNSNFAKMSNNNHIVDKNSFKYLFNEDIYVVSEDAIDVIAEVETEATVKAQTDSSSVITKKTEPEKKIPAIPKIPVIPRMAIKDYAIIVRSQEEMEVGKEFLIKILGAMKLDFNKVDLFSTQDSGEDAIAKSEHKYIISFGIDPARHQQNYNKVVKRDKTTFLFSNDLSELQKDVEKKKALWAALQQIL